MKRGALAVVAGLMFPLLLPAQDIDTSNAATLVSKDNRVEVAGLNGTWLSANPGQRLRVGDRLRTGEDSRASLRMSDGSVLQLDELTTIEIKPAKAADSSATLNVPSGAAYFFSRGKSREVRVETPAATGGIRGTAFLLTVSRADGRTAVTMIEGAFRLANRGGSVTVRDGEQARTNSGGPAKNVYGDTGDTAPWYLVIENPLESGRSLRNVGKPQLLSALADAIKQFPHVAPQLSGGATIVRRGWALDILEEAFDAVGPGCGMRSRILKSIIAAAPDQADELIDLANRDHTCCRPRKIGAMENFSERERDRARSLR